MMLSSRALVFPRRRRGVYTELSFSNEMDIMGPVVYDRWVEQWTLSFGVKKGLFTDTFRPAVGGQSTEADEDVGGLPVDGPVLAGFVTLFSEHILARVSSHLTKK